MQGALVLVRSQLKSISKGSRAVKVRIWFSVVATPLAEAMPAPQISFTWASLGKCGRQRTTRVLLSSTRAAALRMAFRSAPLTISMPTVSGIPSILKRVLARMEASVASASRVRINTWSSSMVRPSPGLALRTAGPPVEKEKVRSPWMALPDSDFKCSVRVKEQLTPAGRSRSK